MSQDAEKRLKERALVLFAYLFVPIFCVHNVWAGPPGVAKEWLEILLMSGVVAFLFVVGGSWSWVGYPLRPLFPIALAVAAYHSAGWAGFGLSAAILALLAGGSLLVIRAIAPKKEAVLLSFPLGDGLYYVVQGGQFGAFNHHRAKPQRFALDIVQLNRCFTRCRGIYPPDAHCYSIYGAEVYSPCDGAVVCAVNNLPDFAPPVRDSRNPGGNHVIIQHKEAGICLKLSHLLSGSVVVKEGDSVRAGQLLGRVGNSGNTTEPHLHIHAQREGLVDSPQSAEGVPMLFEGRFLLRNDLVRRQKAGARTTPTASPTELG